MLNVLAPRRPFSKIWRPGGRSGRPNWQPCLLAAMALIASQAHADEGGEDSPSRFKVSGFATLALSHNNKAQAGAITSFAQDQPARQGWSGDLDSVLGLQLDAYLLPGTSLTLQGVARPDNKMQPQLRMAYLRQQLNSDTSLRLGRIRSPLYFDSDVAEIGYAYLMERPPIPLYGIVNSVTSLDGMDVQWRSALGSAALLVQGYYGQDHYRHQFYNQGNVASADLSDIRGLAVSAALPSVTLRASRTWVGSYTMTSPTITALDQGLGQLSQGVAAIAANPQLPAAMGAALTQQANQISALQNPFNNRPIYTSLGFDANWQDWRFLGEWAQLDSRSAMVGRYKGYQFTVAYNLGNFSPYVSLSSQQRQDSGLNTSALNPTGLSQGLDAGLAQMQGGLNQAAGFANLSMRSASLGLRWDFEERKALKFQFDHLSTPNTGVPGSLAVGQLPFRNTVNLFTVALNIVF